MGGRSPNDPIRLSRHRSPAIASATKERSVPGRAGRSLCHERNHPPGLAPRVQSDIGLTWSARSDPTIGARQVSRQSSTASRSIRSRVRARITPRPDVVVTCTGQPRRSSRAFCSAACASVPAGSAKSTRRSRSLSGVRRHEPLSRIPTPRARRDATSHARSPPGDGAALQHRAAARSDEYGSGPRRRSISRPSSPSRRKAGYLSSASALTRRSVRPSSSRESELRGVGRCRAAARARRFRPLFGVRRARVLVGRILVVRQRLQGGRDGFG